jgi:hypothetical protein
MADYVWDVSSNGAQMMIRDLGYDVQFWFHANSQTYNHQQGWGWSIDGGGFAMGQFDLQRGGGWNLLGTIQVGAGGDRQVGMRIVGAGLGWPTTDNYATLSRATVPGAPYWIDGPRAVSTSEVYMAFNGNGDGGSPLREWQIGYGTDESYPQYFMNPGGGATTIGGLSPTFWFFWARGRNDIGWGPWSGRGQAFPWRVPDPPTRVTPSAFTQTSMHASFRGQFDGGTAHTEFQLAYGLVNDPNQATVIPNANSGEIDISGLVPGRTYYLWARGRNQIGFSKWSSVSVATLIAGAAIKDQNQWKRAVPYVKVGGVWKLARPWVKSAGTWKEVQW